MDAISLILNDHKKVNDLFHLYHLSNNFNEKFTIAQQICMELTVHSFVEEELLYPALTFAIPQGEQAAAHCVHEHTEVKALIDQIMKTSDPSTNEFINLVIQLEQSIMTHVQEEEESILPQFASKVSSDVLLMLGNKIMEYKALAPKVPVFEPETKTLEKVQSNAGGVQRLISLETRR